MNYEPLFITSFLSLDINYKNLYLKLIACKYDEKLIHTVICIL